MPFALRAQVAPPRECHPGFRSTARSTARASEGPSTTTRARRRGFFDDDDDGGDGDDDVGDGAAFRVPASPLGFGSMRSLLEWVLVDCLEPTQATERRDELERGSGGSGRDGGVDATSSIGIDGVSDAFRGRRRLTLVAAPSTPPPVRERREETRRIALGARAGSVDEERERNCD